MRETAGSAAAPAARCRKFRRGSFIFEPPSTSFDQLVGTTGERQWRQFFWRGENGRRAWIEGWIGQQCDSLSTACGTDAEKRHNAIVHDRLRLRAPQNRIDGLRGGMPQKTKRAS